MSYSSKYVDDMKYHFLFINHLWRKYFEYYLWIYHLNANASYFSNQKKSLRKKIEEASLSVKWFIQFYRDIYDIWSI